MPHTEARKALRPLLVLRPEPGASQTAQAARTLGLEPVVAPLFHIAPEPWALSSSDFAGLLAGSANVFRHGGPALTALCHLPVHAVGEATAMAAREAGFTVATVGAGGLQSIASALSAGHYLRLAGESHVPLELPQGVAVTTHVVYAARAMPLAEAAIAAVGEGAVVLLHSGEAARHFDAEMHRLSVGRESVLIAALAPRIAALAGTGWHHIGIAADRSDEAVLALAAQMCQTV